MCLKCSESTDHLFLHCPMALVPWHILLNIANLDWVPPKGIAGMLGISFKAFGSLPKGKILWQVVALSLIWFIWLERSARIF